MKIKKKSKANLLVILTITFLLSASVHAENALTDFKIYPSASMLTTSFFKSNQEVYKFFVDELFTSFKKDISEKSASTDLSCSEQSEMQIGSETNQDKEIQKFLNEFIKIKSQFCINNHRKLPISKISQILVSDKFQTYAFNNLKSSVTSSEGRTCQITALPIIGESEYCFNYSTFNFSNFSIVITIADDSASGAQVPVYLRWTAYIIRSLGAKTQISSIAYGRGPKIYSHFAAKNLMNYQQNEYIVRLNHWISNGEIY